MTKYAKFDNSFFTQKPWWLPDKLYNVVCLRSNSRSKEYMLNLLREKFPDVELINEDDARQKGQLILLYSDSIGLGWGRLEKQYMRKFNEIKVLNGRGRFFNLDKQERIKFLFIRFFEVTFLPEIIFAPFLLLLGVGLAVKDRLVGGF